ncbi:hypothetical protein BDC45DRAFT_306117 [Circinella umbellata]|nr:hypothetical protein BDC45DRAFT_306117 [Circinella umbellata]
MIFMLDANPSYGTLFILLPYLLSLIIPVLITSVLLSDIFFFFISYCMLCLSCCHTLNDIILLYRIFPVLLYVIIYRNIDHIFTS